VVSLTTAEVVPFLRELSARGFALSEEDLASRLLSPGQVGRAFFGDTPSGEAARGPDDRPAGIRTTGARRAAEQTLLGARLGVASAEDLLLSKIVSGRPIDLADADAIVARKGQTLNAA